ncbi:hypothetical protein [Chitinophaga sp. sic0106]|uniref:hypothetical protein n=1 Tax=Chitinophaga sp. sic0106 TaxID=2854785 RepID=UPI001C491E35|nr:hypothetical protein [Chitinophaga sp. sic0106]MBV7531350.1 hypothetical protein [Chitinophaga sp. sic0106]
MEAPCTVQFDTTPTDYVIARAFPTRDRTVEVLSARQVFAPPQLNPRAFVMTLPTPEPYIILINSSPDGTTIGVERSSYMVVPKLYQGQFIEDVTIVVDGGTIDIDPVAGTRIAPIPSLDGYNIARIYRNGASRALRKDRNPEWVQRPGGGFNLTDDTKPFSHGETFVIQLAPFYSSNVAADIFSLNELINSHISNTNNPHAVTKSQVGLGNIPNAKSDAINNNSSDTLATSAAVNALRLSVQNQIAGSGKFFVGDVVRVDETRTITHNRNITGEYVVVGSLVSTGADWDKDNDVIWAVRDLGTNSFTLLLRELSPNIQNIWFYYSLIKI